MHVVFLCLESNKYFFTILIVFVLGLTSQLEIIIVLSFALPDRHLTSRVIKILAFNYLLTKVTTAISLSKQPLLS
jgi:hypothetical protein